MALLCNYTYDPLDRVSSLTPLAQAVFRRFYNGERLITELQGETQRTFVRAGGHLLAQQNRDNDGVAATLIAGDRHNSVLHASEDGRQVDIAYTPFGHRQAEQTIADLPGFNGELPDPVTGHYLLGNGYRAYNPVLMRFNSPDSLSPFGEGGINAYAYGLNNPIHYIDPTGHISFGVAGILGVVFGVAGGAAIATSFSVKESNPTLGNVLMVAGIISSVLGGGVSANKVSAFAKSWYRGRAVKPTKLLAAEHATQRDSIQLQPLSASIPRPKLRPSPVLKPVPVPRVIDISEQLPPIRRMGYPKNRKLTKARFKKSLSEVDRMEVIVEEFRYLIRTDN